MKIQKLINNSERMSDDIIDLIESDMNLEIIEKIAALILAITKISIKYKVPPNVVVEGIETQIRRNRKH